MPLGLAAALAASGPGGNRQAKQAAAVAMLDAYEQDQALPELTDIDSFGTGLRSVAASWVRSPNQDQERRARIVSAVILEIVAASSASDRGSLALLEWGSTWVQDLPPTEFVRLWHLASVAVVTLPPEAAKVSDAVDTLIDRGLDRFPQDPQLRLARLVTRPFLSARSNRPVPRDALSKSMWRGLMAPVFLSAPGQINSAVRELQELSADANAGAEASAYLALLRFYLDDRQRSLTDATTALAGPDSFTAALGGLTAGLVFERLGRHAEAQNALRRAAERTPTTKSVATLLAVHEFLGGRRQQAAAVVTNAYGAETPDPDPWRRRFAGERRLPQHLQRLRQLVGRTAPPFPATTPQPNAPGAGDQISASGVTFAAEGTAQRPLTGKRPPFRTISVGVAADVSVLTGRTPVKGLTADDFELFDNGVRQRIDAVSVGDVPLDVSVVLDLSDTVGFSIDRPAALYQPAQAVADMQTLSESLRSTDRLRLLAVFAEPFEVLPLGPPRSPPQWRRIQTWEHDYTAAVYDAMTAVLVRDTPPHRRHLILAFTDGIDGTSIVRSDQLLEVARQSDAVIHLARHFTPSERSRQRNPRSTWLEPLLWRADPHALEAVARATGGTIRHPEPNASVAGELALLLDQFRQRYILHYVPEGVATSGWHTLEVRIRRPGRYSVSARRGYFGG